MFLIPISQIRTLKLKEETWTALGCCPRKSEVMVKCKEKQNKLILVFWVWRLRSSSNKGVLWDFFRRILMRMRTLTFSSVQFSHSVMSDSLQPHGLQHTRLPCPSPAPGSCSDSCPLSWWCHPTISSSVLPSSSCLQPFPASGSFQMSQFFESVGQSIGISASASVFPMNIQNWFPPGLTVWISLQSKGLSRVFSNTTVQKHQFFGTQLSLWSESHICTWQLEKP